MANPLMQNYYILKEKGIKFPIIQVNISSGMFRAFALLVAIQYIVDMVPNHTGTVLVDDFGKA